MKKHKYNKINKTVRIGKSILINNGLKKNVILNGLRKFIRDDIKKKLRK